MDRTHIVESDFNDRFQQRQQPSDPANTEKYGWARCAVMAMWNSDCGRLHFGARIVEN
jgi:hypothetical protein